MGTSPARTSASSWGCPWGLVYVPTKVHWRPWRVRKYFCATHRPDFFGCLRVAEDHRLLKMAVSTLMKRALLTTWRRYLAHPRISGVTGAFRLAAAGGSFASRLCAACPS